VDGVATLARLDLLGDGERVLDRDGVALVGRLATEAEAAVDRLGMVTSSPATMF